MATCSICGESLKPEQKVCDVCGTSVPASGAVSPPVQFSPSVPPAPPPMPKPAPPVAAPAAGEPVLMRVCPVCQIPYGPDYFDDFCGCGGELVTTMVTPEAPSSEAAPIANPAPFSFSEAPSFEISPPPLPVPVAPAGPVKPAVGTVCLVVYSETKEPIHYCAIDKDVTIIGRSDPVRGDFPDLDLAELFDTDVSRRISRKHAMILRSRTEGTYSLRPLGGNTGTQIEKELAAQLQDYPLTPGTRLVLGGVVRVKFEVIQ